MSDAAIPADLADRLRHARRVMALTGAGISAESGVPTFRQAQTGLWADYRPEDLATPEAFRRDPQRVWDWYAWRRELVRRVEPNAGHRALATLQGRVPDFTLVTQNVDGLHQRAGSSPVIELHGNLFRCKCTASGRVVSQWEESGPRPPPCPHGEGVLRPDVVWFGEMLPTDALSAAEAAADACEVFLSIGTSSLVYPAAALPFAALERGAVVVEVNPQATPLSDLAAYSLRGAAGAVLPALVRAVWGNGHA